MVDVKSDFRKDVDRHVKSNEEVVTAVEAQTEVIKDTSLEAVLSKKMDEVKNDNKENAEKISSSIVGPMQEQTDAFVGPLQVTAKSAVETADKTDDPSVKAGKEDKKKQDQQTLVKLLGGIGDGVNKLFKDAKNFIGDTPTVMQAVLAAGGFFLLAEFLQSSVAQDIIMTIFNSLKQLFGDIQTLSQDFTIGGLIDVVKNNFLTLITLLTAFKPKMMFNLAKKAVMGLARMFDGAAKFIKDGKISKSLKGVDASFKGMKGGFSKFAGTISKSFSGMKKGLGEFGRKLSIQSRLATDFGKRGHGTFDKKIMKAYNSFTEGTREGITNFGGRLKKFGSGVVGGLKSLGKTLSQPGGMKKILSAARLAMKGYFAAMKATVVGSFKFLLGLLLANPITAIIIGIVALLAGLATYFGVFDPLFNAVANVFSSIKSFFVGLYNSFADTYLGKALGLTPMVDDTGASPVTPAPVNTDTQTAEVIEENALNKTAANMNNTSAPIQTNVVTTTNASNTSNTTQSNISIIDTDRLFRHLTNMTI